MKKILTLFGITGFKNIVFTSIVFTVFIFFTGCFKNSTADVQENTTPEVMFLPKKITTFSGDTNIKQIQLNKYNQRGDCIQRDFFDDKDGLIKKEIITYKDNTITTVTFDKKKVKLSISIKTMQNKLLVNKEVFDSQNKSLMKTEYTYKNTSLMQEAIFTKNKLNLKKIYSYKKNKLVSIVYKNPTGSVIQTNTFNYDTATNLLISEVLYDSDKQIIQKTKCSYDKKNRLIQKATFVNNALVYLYEYEYDKNSNVKKEMYKDRLDNVIELKIFEYIKIKK